MKREVIAETEVNTDSRKPAEILQDAYDNKDFFDIENDVAAELGLYLDFSSIRGDSGTVFIFSDPDHEEDGDMWMGPDDAELARIDFGDYAEAVADKVLSKDESQWEDAYQEYIQSLIEE